MNKDVLVTIKGLQYDLSENDKKDDEDTRIETLTRGTFYQKENHNYITYEESPDGTETIKTLLKFSDHDFELTRKGTYSVHMTFEEGKKNYTDYHTPFGDFVIGIDTDTISLSSSEDEINMTIAYEMEMNYEHLANCRIDMQVKSV